MFRVENTWTAVVTPFNFDYTIDWDGFLKNIEFQISEGITGIVPVGTTGESPTLDWNEHNQTIDFAINHCKGKCGILAGTGSNSTSEAIKSSGHAVKSGSDALLLVDCYYNGPSSQELRDEYYAKVAKSFKDTPIVPYIIPGRSGTMLAVEDLAILSSKYSNIKTVKEATGDLERMAKTRALTDECFSIMSGDDDITFTMISDSKIKANGVISVATNVAPGAIKKMVELALNGDFAESERIKNALAPLLGIITVKVDNKRLMPNGDTVTVNDRYRNPLAIKTLMTAFGMPSGFCRAPLGRMTKAGIDVVRNAAKSVLGNNPEILKPIEDFYGVNLKVRLNDDSIWNELAL